jgi:hypothetical protein
MAPAPFRCRRAGARLGLPLLGALLLAAPQAARAGSVTAESIWDKGNAIQRAQSQLPAGATVTRTQCTEVNVRTGNYRYICTLYFTTAPAAPSSSAPSAPAP